MSSSVCTYTAVDDAVVQRQTHDGKKHCIVIPIYLRVCASVQPGQSECIADANYALVSTSLHAVCVCVFLLCVSVMRVWVYMHTHILTRRTSHMHRLQPTVELNNARWREGEGKALQPKFDKSFWFLFMCFVCVTYMCHAHVHMCHMCLCVNLSHMHACVSEAVVKTTIIFMIIDYISNF